MRDRLSRPLSARIDTDTKSGIQASDVIDRLLEVFPRDAIDCVQPLFNGQFMVTFASEDEKAAFVQEESVDLRGISCPIHDADSRFRFVKIKNWPHEITNNEVRSLLRPYGNITDIRRDVHAQSGILNGDITVLMNIITPIPSYLWFCGNQGNVHHRDQQRTCRLCGSLNHFAKDCPRCLNCRHRGHTSEDCLLPSRLQENEAAPVWPSIHASARHLSQHSPTHEQSEQPEPSEQQRPKTTQEEPEMPDHSDQEEPELPLVSETIDRTPMSDIEEASAATNAKENDTASSDSDSSTSDLEITHTIAIVEEGPKKRPASRQRPESDIKREHLDVQTVREEVSTRGFKITLVRDRQYYGLPILPKGKFIRILDHTRAEFDSLNYTEQEELLERSHRLARIKDMTTTKK